MLMSDKQELRILAFWYSGIHSQQHLTIAQSDGWSLEYSGSLRDYTSIDNRLIQLTDLVVSLFAKKTSLAAEDWLL